MQAYSEELKLDSLSEVECNRVFSMILKVKLKFKVRRVLHVYMEVMQGRY